jgi:hypothetical protein
MRIPAGRFDWGVVRDQRVSVQSAHQLLSRRVDRSGSKRSASNPPGCAFATSPSAPLSVPCFVSLPNPGPPGGDSGLCCATPFRVDGTECSRRARLSRIVYQGVAPTGSECLAQDQLWLALGYGFPKFRALKVPRLTALLCRKPYVWRPTLLLGSRRSIKGGGGGTSLIVCAQGTGYALPR